MDVAGTKKWACSPGQPQEIKKKIVQCIKHRLGTQQFQGEIRTGMQRAQNRGLELSAVLEENRTEIVACLSSLTQHIPE